MKLRCSVSLVLLFLIPPGNVRAADLTKIERKIITEPVYQTKTPKYALLVFGPEAKHHVWLVQDGDALFVDRNGNGDLTDAGEKVAAKKGDGTDPKEDVFAFEIDELRAGERVHKNLRLWISKLDYLADRDAGVKAFLAAFPKARGYALALDVEMPGWKGRGIGGRVEAAALVRDAAGFLQFAVKPAEAPIIHFGGPWQITLFGAGSLTVGGEEDVVLGLGTPGVGHGSTTFVAYEGIVPKDRFPTISLVYPSASGASPIRERHELKERC